jgi:hypothetical protein
MDGRRNLAINLVEKELKPRKINSQFNANILCNLSLES